MYRHKDFDKTVHTCKKIQEFALHIINHICVFSDDCRFGWSKYEVFSLCTCPRWVAQILLMFSACGAVSRGQNILRLLLQKFHRGPALAILEHKNIIATPRGALDISCYTLFYSNYRNIDLTKILLSRPWKDELTLLVFFKKVCLVQGARNSLSKISVLNIFIFS